MDVDTAIALPAHQNLNQETSNVANRALIFFYLSNLAFVDKSTVFKENLKLKGKKKLGPAAEALFTIAGYQGWNKGHSRAPAFKSKETTEQFLVKHPELMGKMLERYYDQGENFDLDEFGSDPIIQDEIRLGKALERNRNPQETFDAEQQKATRNSWDADYKKGPDDLLWTHIKDCFSVLSDHIYAHYTEIIQSSGMGKSRAVDELSKTRFTIPICLRDPKSAGFPPSDDEVYKYLTTGSIEDGFVRSAAFFTALFEDVKKEVQTSIESLRRTYPDVIMTHELVAGHFRAMMTDGQTCASCNSYRKQLYAKVAEKAQQLENEFKAEEEDRSQKLRRAFEANRLKKERKERGEAAKDEEDTTDVGALLIPKRNTESVLYRPWKALRELETVIPQGSAPDTREPRVLLGVDEAQILASLPANSSVNLFSQLRRVLRELVQGSLFSVFLSTTGKLTQFVPLKQYDPSMRINLGPLNVNEPFVDLGFDQWVDRGSDGKFTLAQVSSLGHMMKYGRPLFGSRVQFDDDSTQVRQDVLIFAASKLVCCKAIFSLSNMQLSEDQQLAVLCQRLPIEFVSTNYLQEKVTISTALRQEMESEARQVEAHMRVCLKINRKTETMKTVAPSEPLLSEAAFTVMQATKFNAPDALKKIFSSFCINIGDGGEFLALLLATLARDAAVRLTKENTFWSQFTSMRDNDWERAIPVSVFLENLFNVEANPALRDVFKKYAKDRMHFNHFIKVHDSSVLRADSLLGLIARGAAVLCPDKRQGFDFLIPYLDGEDAAARSTDLLLEEKRVRALVFKVESNLFVRGPDWRINSDMGKALEEIKGPPATMRIVLSFRTSEHAIHHVSQDGADNIWCTGLSPRVLKPISTENLGDWNALLDACVDDRSAMFFDEDGKESVMRMSMNPCFARVGGFWDKHWKLNTEEHMAD